MSIRSLTDQVLNEAVEGRRRVEGEPDGTDGPAPIPPDPPDVAPTPRIGLIEPRSEPHAIPGGIADRFRIRRTQIVETFVKEASLPVTPPPETPSSSEESADDETDTAPITIELQSH